MTIAGLLEAFYETPLVDSIKLEKCGEYTLFQGEDPLPQKLWRAGTLRESGSKYLITRIAVGFIQDDHFVPFNPWDPLWNTIVLALFVNEKDYGYFPAVQIALPQLVFHALELEDFKKLPLHWREIIENLISSPLGQRIQVSSPDTFKVQAFVNKRPRSAIRLLVLLDGQYARPMS
jgi:hypothetical protein